MSHEPDETMVVEVHMTPTMHDLLLEFGQISPMYYANGTPAPVDVENVIKAVVRSYFHRMQATRKASLN